MHSRSGLYWTLPRDRVNAAIREARESGLIGPRRSGPAPHEAASGGASTKSKMSAKPGELVGALDCQRPGEKLACKGTCD